MAPDSPKQELSMKKTLLSIILLVFSGLSTLAQSPVISGLSTRNLYPRGTIVITGSGFSSTSADLSVWFGHQEGRIVTSNEFAIEVEVPAGANYSNIEVINRSTGKIGRSGTKFLSSFYGEPFDPSRFSGITSASSLNELRDICNCDLNLDGKSDLIATRFSASTRMLVLQNGTLQPGSILWKFTIEYNLNFSSDHVTCGDVDGDGFPELVVTKGGSSSRNSVFVVRNTTPSKGADIAFSSLPFILPMDVNHVAIRSAIQDLNGDGRPELVVTNTTNNTLYIYANNPTQPLGANPFNTAPQKVIVTGLTNTYGLDVQDFDGDGKSDIMVSPISSSDYYVLRNTSSGSITFAAPQRIPLDGQLRNIISADLNNDGKLDLVCTSTNTNRAMILYNQSTAGTISFSTAPVQLTTDSGPWGVTITDIDGDTDPDIIIAHQLASTLGVFLNDGAANPTFTRQTIPTPRPSRNLASGDLDGDGKPDLAIASYVIGVYSVDVLRNTICHKPKILNDLPIAVCNNPVNLRTIPALNVTFTWREGTTTVKTGADPFASISAAGNYTVSATTVHPSAAECSNISSPSVTVTGGTGNVPQDPVLTVNSPLCAGATLNLSTTAAAGASYKWSGPGGWTETTTTATLSRPNVASSFAGEYTVQIIAGVCKSNVSAPKLVSIVAVDNFAITSTSSTNSSCQPNPVKLSINNVSGFSYAWRRNNEPYGTPSTVNTLDVFQTGAYYVQVSNAGLGCPAREIGPVQVAILQAPVADFTIGNPRCANAPVQFTDASTSDAAAVGVAPLKYLWNFGNGTNSSDKNPTSIFPTGGISYTVQLTVSYEGVAGCTSSKSIPLTVTSTTLPVIVASPANICPGQASTLTVTPSFSSVTWEHGPTGPSVVVTTPGVYKANATDASGCIVPRSITVGSPPVPELTVTAASTSIPTGQSTQLTATGAHTFEWSPRESLNNANIPDPIASPLQTTTYSVKGSFTGGCSTTAEITITVDGSIINIQVPPAFTPNSDGSNDQLIIPGVEQYPDCTLSVFDARGKRIYQKRGYNNEWDGTYDGRPVPGGTYYYVFSCPQAKPMTGNILIFR